jgi:fructan beta-fructosidase
MAKSALSWILFLTVLPAAGAGFYQERYRPQVHFSPVDHWTNDPCGLVYADGLYHLFFQQNPLGNEWGHMSWGHAVSPDLVHWTQRSLAIPESKDVMIFTGSSVVDVVHSSGLCQASKTCIVSIYTGHTFKTATTPQLQNQNLAYSEDGITWKKYAKNPVLDLHMANFRDPKVFWHAPTKQWIMVAVLPEERKARLFRSPNLKDWAAMSDFGPAGATAGEWECPDLYALPVDGDPQKTRWVMKIGINPGHVAGGSGEQYFIGQFDGKQFINDNPASQTLWLDYGRDSYCALTFNNDPMRAPTMIGWMNNWQYAKETPTAPWRGSMTLPRSLELHTLAEGVRLTQQPLSALQQLRQSSFGYRGKNIAELNRKLQDWPHRSQTFELDSEIEAGSAQKIEWKLLEGDGEYTLVGYDRATAELYVDRTHSGATDFNPKFPSRTVAPLKLGAGPLKLHILVDTHSVEVYAQQGQTVMSNLVFPKPTSSHLSLQAQGGYPGALQVNMWELKSAWRKP